jgi:GAF domain-containing protein
VQAINKLDGSGCFTAEDIRTLSVVADTAGVTLHKARLLQDANTARAATEALAAVVRVVNDSSADGDIEALASRLIEIAVDLIDGEESWKQESRKGLSTLFSPVILPPLPLRLFSSRS